MLPALIGVALGQLTFLGLYFYFRAPRVTPLSEEATRNAVKIAIRQSHEPLD